MKGKMLSKEEILNKNGGYVYIEPIMELYKKDEGKAQIEINKNRIFVFPIKEDKDVAPWTISNNLDNINDNTWLNIYEWIEDEQTITEETNKTKTYKGSEILAMIENGELKNDDIIFDKDKEKWTVEELFNEDFGLNRLDKLIKDAPFTIKQKPVDFMTAINSNKNIRPVSLTQEKKFHPYTYWLGFMVSSLAYKNEPLELINGLWEIQL